MKALNKIILAGLLAASGTGAVSVPVYAQETDIVPYNVETWYGERSGSVNGYTMKVAATMTYANGNWSCRGWLLEASSSAVSVSGALMSPGSKIVSVYISINGVPTGKCLLVTVQPR